MIPAGSVRNVPESDSQTGEAPGTHRPHRALNQAAPLRPLPDGVTDLNYFRLRRRNRAGCVIDEYRLVAYGYRHPQAAGNLPARRVNGAQFGAGQGTFRL